MQRHQLRQRHARGRLPVPDCRVYSAPRARQEAGGYSEGNHVTTGAARISRPEAILRGGLLFFWSVHSRLARIRRAARIAMGASSNSPPGRTIAAIQNKVVRIRLMGCILPFGCQAPREIDHGQHESVTPVIQARAIFHARLSPLSRGVPDTLANNAADTHCCNPSLVLTRLRRYLELMH